MRVIAFVGPSGTGKSYRSVMVSQQYGADAIIDDGLQMIIEESGYDI